MLASIAPTSLLVLSVIVLVGGLIGFLKAKSKASLIAGVISSALLAFCYSVALRNVQQGLVAGIAVSAILCGVFGMRLKKTGKFMPSGMLLTLCGIEVILLGAALALH